MSLRSFLRSVDPTNPSSSTRSFLRSVDPTTPGGRKAIAGTLIGGAVGGPLGAFLGYQVGSGRGFGGKLARSIDPTNPGAPPQFEPPPSTTTPPPKFSEYVPGPGQFPKFQAPTQEELTKGGIDYVKALEQAFGYTPVQDLRSQALESQKQLFNEELQRANALTATGMAGQGSISSPAYAQALGRNVMMELPRLAQAQYQIETDYRDALAREMARRQAEASAQQERAYGKSIQDYLLSQYAPFQYGTEYGQARYGYEGLLPWQAGRETGMQQAYLNYLGQLARYQGRQQMIGTLLGGGLNVLGSVGGALAGRKA